MSDWLVLALILTVLGFWMSVRFEAVIIALTKINNELSHQGALRAQETELVITELSLVRQEIEDLNDEKVRIRRRRAGDSA